MSLSGHILISGGEWDIDVARISMKNCRNDRSDNALESPSPTKLVSIKLLSARGYERGELTSLSGHIVIWEGEWDKDVAQISMKNCRNQGSDNAL